MKRLVKVVFTIAAIVAIGAGSLIAQAKTATPIRGDAEIGYLKPVTSVDHKANMVKTTSYIKDLSGGEKRRAFLAMTLLQGAGLVLLDEPLANLDIKYQIEIMRAAERTSGKEAHFGHHGSP